MDHEATPEGIEDGYDDYGEKALRSYRHIPHNDADSLFRSGQQKRYRVETINWTFATDHATGQILGLEPGEKLQDGSTVDGARVQVHHNVYDLTLEQLVRFIRDTVEVAEDIIAIEPEDGVGHERSRALTG